MADNDKREIVIIGLGASGLYAMKSALAYNRNCHVSLIEKRDFDQFSPCGLPFVLEGIVESFEELKHVVPDVKNKFTKFLQHEVTSIDAENKVVTALDLVTKEEKQFPYDALIMSTGASPINLPIPGAQEFLGKGIHFVSTIEDSQATLDAAKTSKMKKACVVGGGAIGLEVAVGLREHGLEVFTTKRTEPALHNNLDPEFSPLIVNALEDLGIKVLFGKGIDSINGTDHVESVTIAGEVMPCDMVVMAVGMRANTKLAESIGAKIENRMVTTNNRMETSVKDVYATGDLIQSYSRIDKTPASMMLATSAFRQGMTAGVNAAGGNTEYPGVLNTFVTGVGKLIIAATGYNIKTAKALGYNAKAISTKRETKPHYVPGAKDIHMRMVVDLDTNKILGAQAIGEDGPAWRINVFALAIHAGLTLYDMMDTELGYFPAVSQMYDPIAQLVEIGMKRLKLPPRECKEAFFPQPIEPKSE